MRFQVRNSSAPSENDEASEEDHLHDDTSKGGAGPSKGGKSAHRGGKMPSAAAEVCMHARHVHACLLECHAICKCLLAAKRVFYQQEQLVLCTAAFLYGELLRFKSPTLTCIEQFAATVALPA